MNKNILENQGLYGLGGNNTDITRNRTDPALSIGHSKSKDFDDDNTPIFPLNPKFSLNSRQEEIKQAFTSNRDAFVSYPPSAGKTEPIKRGIIEKINLAPIEPYHILYVVPRKQLAAQVADEFRKDIYIPKYGNNNGYRAVAEHTGGQKDPIFIPGIYDNYVPIIVATYESAANILNGPFSNKLTHIIIDEVQELVPHPNEPINEGLESRFNSLVQILSNASPIPRTSIILMTGSINQVSVKYLADYFNKQFNRKFEVIPRFNPNLPPQPYGQQTDGYEGELLNRSNITIQPMKPLSGFPQQTVPVRLNLIKNIVINKQYQSVMIIFSKQRTGQGIFKMLEELIKALPAYPSGYFYEADNDHVKQLIQNKGQGARLTDNSNIEFLKYFDLDAVMQRGNNSQTNVDTQTGTEKNENNILYQSVIRGIAPLIGSMNQLHKKIIQYYFSDSKPPKIHMILGTDALG